MSELKNCPFCGTEPIVNEIEAHTHSFATFMPDHPGSCVIECPACSCGMIDASKELVVAAWNRRTPTPPSPQPVCDLVQAVDSGKVAQPMKDEQIMRLMLKACHSDPIMTSGEYCLSQEEIVAFAKALLAAQEVK